MMSAERVAVRWGVPVLLVGSCGGATAISLSASRSDIPSDDEDLLEFAARVRRERDERIAKIREKKYDIEPNAGLKELVDTQDEFRERIMGRIERIIASARF